VSDDCRTCSNRHSLHRKLLPLGDHVIVLPTHGGGSLCGKGISGTRLSTIGYERRANPALKHRDKQAFVRAALGGHIERATHQMLGDLPSAEVWVRSVHPTSKRGRATCLASRTRVNLCKSVKGCRPRRRACGSV
jgi:hypothetical protein